jgi:hypothetical protein
LSRPSAREVGWRYCRAAASAGLLMGSLALALGHTRYALFAAFFPIGLICWVGQFMARCPRCGKSVFLRETIASKSLLAPMMNRYHFIPERHCSRCDADLALLDKDGALID